MRIEATTSAPAETAADTVAIGLYAGKGVAHDLEGAPLGALLESGEARSDLGALALAHAAGRRWILAGLGPRADFDGLRARTVAAEVAGRARELGTRDLCWELPHHAGEDIVAALVEGTLLADYRFERYRAPAPEERGGLTSLTLSAHHDVAEAVRISALVAQAQNRCRELQDRAPNDCTPAALAERARELAAAHPALSCEVLDRAAITAGGLGAFASVASGTRNEPRLIALRHEPAGASGVLTAWVGKGVTFDSGGYALKPRESMIDMKYDMSGAAAVLEAIGAVAELGLPVRLLAVIGATENVLDGQATQPGDVVRALDGTTIQVDNPDAEGRLILADCLTWAARAGAERLVDLATLTGGAVIALGSVYAALFASDEALAGELEAAAAASGEPVWRMPLNPAYAKAVEGTFADLRNITDKRTKAQACTAAAFLHHFAGELPWAHLDIAGVADGTGWPWAQKGGTGFGVRLLVALARAQATPQS